MSYPTAEDIRLFEEQLNKKDDKEESDTNVKLNSQKIISDKTENSKTIKTNKNIVILSMSKNIDLIFDKATGNLLYITYNKNPHLYSYNDNDNDKKILNIPIPNEIKDLNRNDILSKSTTLIGSIISVKSTKLSKCIEEPNAISFILFEKIDGFDNFDIKLIPNLEYNDMIIKESNFIDVIFANINIFWVIIKDDNDVQQLIYYYKSSKYIDNIFNYNYLYDNIPIIDYKIICSLWSYHDITPSVIYLIVHDEHFNVVILEYTIFNIDSKIENLPTLPKIVLYFKDERLFNCGKYLSHCVNYNISMFSILLEVENNVKTFYTGVITLLNNKSKDNTKLLLEISYSHNFPKEVSIEDAQFMIYSIMEKTEKSIKIQNFKEKEEETKMNKRLTYIKEKKEEEVQKAEEFKKQKEKEAELMAEALIKEEEKKQKEIEKKQKEAKLKKQRKKKKLNKERLEQERLEKERLEKKRLEKKRLEQERLEQERLEKERLEKERLEKERLEQERLEQERLEQEHLEQEHLEKERLKKERLEQERLEKERLLQQENLLKEALLNKKENKEIISNYHISNSIERKHTTYTLFYSFIYHLSMIDAELANKIIYLSDEIKYIELIYDNRITIMYALDMLVINNIHIISIQKKIYENQINGYNISAIYGSILPIIYCLILKDIGYNFTPFSKYDEPLKMIDVDTMIIKLLDDFIETHTETEYIKNSSIIIDYYTDEKPITQTKIKSSSIHTLLSNCWDLNYTSAILLYEEEKEPYIIRHPDFTEFIFGNQPLQLLFGRNKYNLYDYSLTMKRIEKFKYKWY